MTYVSASGSVSMLDATGVETKNVTALRLDFFRDEVGNCTATAGRIAGLVAHLAVERGKESEI